MGSSLIFLFAKQSVAKAASWQFAYLFIRRTKRGESSVSWQFAYSQNEAKREQRPRNSLIRYSQNEAKREQRPGNSLILYIILNYILTIFFCSQCTTQTMHIEQNKKNGHAPGPLGDFVKSLVTERIFLFFFYFLKKISINCRFFTQKEHPC